MVLLAAAGCGADSAVPCTMIGTPVGIGLSIPQPAGITRATLDACWGGRCVTRQVGLFPESAAGATTCSGGVCGASAVPTGGLRGFADVPGLPAGPVRVTVRFDDGKPHGVEVTPSFSEPNGPACGKAGPQAQLLVGAGGELRAR